MSNEDSWFLENRILDPNSSLDGMAQAMRIALYDEYKARAYYKKVVETFGEIAPFFSILKAEERHIGALEEALKRHNIPEVIDDWERRVSISKSFRENCEIGVSSEIENIKMYDALLPLVYDAKIRDIFFRLQACSYNNHLPAFRRCIEKSSQISNSKESKSAEGLMPDMQKMMQKLQSGEMTKEEMQKNIESLLKGIGGDFIFGAAIGAALGAILGSEIFQKSDNLNSKKES